MGYLYSYAFWAQFSEDLLTSNILYASDIITFNISSLDEQIIYYIEINHVHILNKSYAKLFHVSYCVF